MCARTLASPPFHFAFEALVISHELSDTQYVDTYIARALHPVRPLISFGRSARAYPQVKAKNAVFHWWQELPRGVAPNAMFARRAGGGRFGNP